MSEPETRIIQELRQKGAGYKLIAAALGVSRDTVRGICKRYRISDGATTASTPRCHSRLLFSGWPRWRISWKVIVNSGIFAPKSRFDITSMAAILSVIVSVSAELLTAMPASKRINRCFTFSLYLRMFIPPFSAESAEQNRLVRTRSFWINALLQQAHRGFSGSGFWVAFVSSLAGFW